MDDKKFEGKSYEDFQDSLELQDELERYRRKKNKSLDKKEKPE